MDFHTITPRIWKGRYNRIEGNAAVFHVRRHSDDYRTVIEWPQHNGDLLYCWATRSVSHDRIVAAVMTAKRGMGGRGPGAFQINEFGQVLVPASKTPRTRSLVGTITGPMTFDSPLTEKTFDLSSTEDCRPGKYWDRPYIGMPFNLSRGDELYFWREDDTGGRIEYPEKQDPKLIQALRSLRPSGPVRFIVNPWGIVLTKVQDPNSPARDARVWHPYFVGHIDRSKWFAKEGHNGTSAI